MAECIEREAVLKRLLMVSMGDDPYSMGIQRGVDHAIGVVNETPAADVAPVVHGEWVVCGDGENVPWMCSHCGKTTAHKYKVMYGNYCPNCGARMDGDSNA